jgi:hypothetical protein
MHSPTSAKTGKAAKGLEPGPVCADESETAAAIAACKHKTISTSIEGISTGQEMGRNGDFSTCSELVVRGVRAGMMTAVFKLVACWASKEAADSESKSFELAES